MTNVPTIFTVILPYLEVNVASVTVVTMLMLLPWNLIVIQPMDDVLDVSTTPKAIIVNAVERVIMVSFIDFIDISCERSKFSSSHS